MRPSAIRGFLLCAVLAVVAGCQRSERFVCALDIDCPNGRCELPERACSVLASDCESQRRWDDSAGDLGGCVPVRG